MTPDDYCQQKAAASGSSFYYSFLFLPAEKRRAITAFYAFCREVDDVADEASDLDVARAKLAWWRTEVADLMAGHPSHPVTKALAPFVAPMGIDGARMNEIIDGMEMDLVRHRYADFEELRLYCHRAAGVVGQLSAGIFGYRHAATLDYAEELGLAFQLTNIIRDVGEDARRGRVYLPADELARHGLTVEDILSRRGGEAFRAVMAEQADRAEATYARALARLHPEDRRNQRAGLIMAAIYRTLLAEIRRDGFPVLEGRVSLTPIRKLWIAWKTWIGS
ncbi:MAG: presqualene diphosphate synthase HpnD [Burkholderiales bacterium]|nr:presqualene diphosphate synthase HpnD [Burkholderiales bacterium]